MLNFIKVFFEGMSVYLQGAREEEIKYKEAGK